MATVRYALINFMELIGESMGMFERDLYKRLKIMRDVDAIIAETRASMELYGLDEEAVREALFAEYWEEQPPEARSQEALGNLSAYAMRT
jgi:hypothetical protein